MSSALYITSKPQKLLIALSTLIFIVGLIPFLLVIGGSLQSLLPKPISISAASVPPVNSQDQQFSNGVLYDELIKQLSGNAVLQAAGNVVVTSGNSQVRIGDKYIQPEAGILFLKIRQATINLGVSKLELQSVSGILDTAKGIFIITEGEAEVSGQNAGINKAIQIDVNGNSIVEFDRNLFTSDSTYSQLIAYLASQQMTNDNLSDLSAPEVGELTPPSGSSTESENIDLQGKTEAGAKLTVSGQEVAVDGEGKFIARLPLTLGENSFVIKTVDKFSNSAEITFRITRTAPLVPCQSGVFKPDLICLINQYRQQNGLEALSEDVKLSTTASDHSDWMAANGTLSHTGIDSSAPWDRCNSHGTTCDSETLAVNTNATAANIFNQWKNSGDHNAVLLGSHSFIGIGITSGYVTGVFR